MAIKKNPKATTRTAFITSIVEAAVKHFSNSDPKPTQTARGEFSAAAHYFARDFINFDLWLKVKGNEEAKRKLGDMFILRAKEAAGELFADEADAAVAQASTEMDKAILRADPATDEPGRIKFVEELRESVSALYASEHPSDSPEEIANFSQAADGALDLVVNVFRWLDTFRDNAEFREQAPRFVYYYTISYMTDVDPIDFEAEFPRLVEQLIGGPLNA